MIKKTLVVTLCSVMASLLGFFSQVLFFRTFGASAEMDAYFVALSMPAAVAGMAPAVISALIIPYLARCEAAPGGTRMPEGAIFISTAVIAALVLATGIAFSYVEMNTNSSAPPVPVRTREVLSWFLWATAALGIMSGFLSALLNYRRRFVVPAVTPLFVPLLIIVAVIALGESLGVIRIAVGFLAGALLQFCVLYLVARPSRNPLQFNADTIAELKQIAVKIPMVMMSLLPFAIITPISYYLATGLPDGSISALGYGTSFSGFLSVAASIGASIVGFSSLATAHAKGRLSEEHAKFQRSVTYVLIVSIATAGAIITCADELVAVVYHGAAGTKDGGSLLPPVMSWYVVSAVAIAGINVVRTMAYARGEQALISGCGIAAILAFCVLATGLARLFGVFGIAIANAVVFWLFLVFLVMYYHKSTEHLFGRKFVLGLASVSLNAALASGLVQSVVIHLPENSPTVQLGILVVAYALVFFALSTLIIKVEEVTSLAHILRLSPRKSR